MFKSKPHGLQQEVLLPDFSDDDNTTTTTTTKSRRVSFGTNFVKEFIVGSAVSAKCVLEYEQAFSSSDSSNANTTQSPLESGIFNHTSLLAEENCIPTNLAPSVHPPEADVSEGHLSKRPRFASTICFNVDSPTADMEFTEGCLTLAKSILDKKNKEMKVIIQAKPKSSKEDLHDKEEETKHFEGSQFDMSVTHCFKPKEIRREEKKFDTEKTKIFNGYDDEMSMTNCNQIFQMKTQNLYNKNDDSDEASDDSFKENKIPLNMIMHHLDKDDSDLGNELFIPKKSLNDVLKVNKFDLSGESEKLDINESMEISGDDLNEIKIPLVERKFVNEQNTEVCPDLNSTEGSIAMEFDMSPEKLDENHLETVPRQSKTPDKLSLGPLKSKTPDKLSLGLSKSKTPDKLSLGPSKSKTPDKLSLILSKSPEKIIKGINGGSILELEPDPEQLPIIGSGAVENPEKKNKSTSEPSEETHETPKLSELTFSAMHKAFDSGTFVLGGKSDTFVIAGKSDSQTFTITGRSETFIVADKHMNPALMGVAEAEEGQETGSIVSSVAGNAPPAPVKEVKKIEVEETEELATGAAISEKSHSEPLTEMVIEKENFEIDTTSKMETNEVIEPEKPHSEIPTDMEIEKGNFEINKSSMLETNEVIEPEKSHSEIPTDMEIEKSNFEINKSSKMETNEVIEPKEAYSEFSFGTEKENFVMIKSSMETNEVVEPEKFLSEIVTDIDKGNSEINEKITTEQTSEVDAGSNEDQLEMNIEVEEVEAEGKTSFATEAIISLTRADANVSRAEIQESGEKMEETLCQQEKMDVDVEPDPETNDELKYIENSISSAEKQDFTKSPTGKMGEETMSIDEGLPKPSAMIEESSKSEILEESKSVNLSEKFISVTEPDGMVINESLTMNTGQQENVARQAEEDDTKVDGAAAPEDTETANIVDKSTKEVERNELPHGYENPNVRMVPATPEPRGDETKADLFRVNESASFIQQEQPTEPVVEHEDACEPPPVDEKILRDLRIQSEEPGALWTVTTVKYKRRKTAEGEWSTRFRLMQSYSSVNFHLQVSEKDSLDSCSTVSRVEVQLEADDTLRRKEYRPVLEFGIRQQRKHVDEHAKMARTAYQVPYFLDHVNLFTVKLNAYLGQIYSIVTLYPGAKLDGSVLSFRLFSFPIFFSVTVSVNLTDFYRLSRSSLSYEYDFGQVNEAAIGDMFEACLKEDNSLCRFVIACNEYLVGIERESGRVSKRNHIRLLPKELHQ